MSNETEAPAPRRRLFVLLPLLVFLGLAGLFLSQLLSGRDTSESPSALIGLPAPQTNLPPLEGVNLPGLDSKNFAGRVTLVNVFASWCIPCREEHPVLKEIAKDDRLNVVAINYKDQPETPAASSATSAIRIRPSASIRPDARRSTGASMACRRPSSSARTAGSPTSMSGR